MSSERAVCPETPKSCERAIHPETPKTRERAKVVKPTMYCERAIYRETPEAAERAIVPEQPLAEKQSHFREETQRSRASQVSRDTQTSPSVPAHPLTRTGGIKEHNMPTLFDNIPAQTTSARPDSTTSVAAAEHAQARAGSQMSRYLTELVKARHHGLTDHEAAERLGLPVGTICARRGSKHGKQYVVDSGRRRDSAYGVANVVWVHQLYAGADHA